MSIRFHICHNFLCFMLGFLVEGLSLHMKMRKLVFQYMFLCMVLVLDFSFFHTKFYLLKCLISHQFCFFRYQGFVFLFSFQVHWLNFFQRIFLCSMPSFSISLKFVRHEGLLGQYERMVNDRPKIKKSSICG